MLFIEYDVTPHGAIEVVSLINAVEENGDDAEGTDWLACAWPSSTTTVWGAPASQPLSSL